MFIQSYSLRFEEKYETTMEISVELFFYSITNTN